MSNIWTATNYGGVGHEYILRTQDPQLVEDIMRSQTTERYKGHLYHVLFKDGYKYWVMGPVINRKRQTRDEWLRDPLVTDQTVSRK